MEFNQLKQLIIDKKVSDFLKQLETLDLSEFDINQRQQIRTVVSSKDNMSEKEIITVQHKGLLHYLIDSDNLPMLDAFLNLAGVDKALAYTSSVQTVFKQHRFFNVQSRPPVVTSQTPAAYAQSHRRTTMFMRLTGESSSYEFVTKKARQA